MFASYSCEQAVLAERESCTKKYSTQISDLKSRLELYLSTKTASQMKCSELEKDLEAMGAEHETFCAEMQASRQELLVSAAVDGVVYCVLTKI